MADFDDVYKIVSDNEIIELGGGPRQGVLRLGKEIDLDGRGVRFTFVSGISLNGGTGVATIGEPQGGIHGTLDLYTIKLEGQGASITAGGGGGRGNGSVTLFDRRGIKSVQLSGEHGNLELGGVGVDGDIRLHDDKGNRTVDINGGNAHAIFGGNSRDGLVEVKNGAGVTTIQMIGRHGNMVLGGTGADGDLTLKSSQGEDAIVLDADDAKIIVGGVGRHGDIYMRNNLNEDTIHIIGSEGDIHFLNADFAEEFTVQAEAVAVASPGTVMALDEAGLLVPAVGAYNTAVVGVIAGAGCYKPAMVLDKRGGEDRRAVAMVGKAMVQVSACNGAVKVGDLLTTSELAGVAMKVSDRSRALGAVIGKALAKHDKGTALVPVLVNLQ